MVRVDIIFPRADFGGQLAALIQYAHPTAESRIDFFIEEDLLGQRLVGWNSAKLGAPPTVDGLLAIKSAALAEAAATKDRLRQAKQFLRGFDPATATAGQVRTAVGAIVVILKHMLKDEG